MADARMQHLTRSNGPSGPAPCWRGTVATERALAVGQLSSGDTVGAGRTLEALTELAPNDAAIASQYAVVLCMLGDVTGCVREMERALALDPG
jgi:Flp pilus assembly protein TadD